MLQFKTWLVNTITSDDILKTYLRGDNYNWRVFPADVDVQPEQFPVITYNDAGVAVLSNPIGAHIGIMQLNIWSTNNALEVENIYDQLQRVLNFQSSLTTTTTINGILWWMRENGARDMHTPSRRLWRKVMDIKFWTTKPDYS